MRSNYKFQPVLIDKRNKNIQILWPATPHNKNFLIVFKRISYWNGFMLCHNLIYTVKTRITGLAAIMNAY